MAFTHEGAIDNVQILGISDMLPLLPITYYPLPITHHPLPIPHSPFPIPHSPFPIPHSPFPIPSNSRRILFRDLLTNFMT
ncbi:MULTISPECIES: hypothetical protein [unclassified Moorena]|uniref:hypothetical protein n=1 Tax=unclassified Moorena TaxID=2683338 RepID=UPI0013BDD109|nr:MULTISPECIES: hypothetical protein [unclassified Moorena]NER86454.1 hypothetical protein [Moorena sp. SIO3A2]NET66125.1 hypothetical protein [Moorena sp. SIO1G6]